MVPTKQDSPHDHDAALERTLFERDFIKFLVVLETGNCTAYGLNRCLAFAAAAQGMGNFSEELVEAGADVHLYLNGRLDRAALKGSVEKIDRWRKVGADIHHDEDQPLRSALFGMQQSTTVHLVKLGCSFDRALAQDRLQNAVSMLDNGADILKFSLKMKTGFIEGKFEL